MIDEKSKASRQKASAKYRASHREECRERTKEWTHNHPTERYKAQREWKKRNPDKVAIYGRRGTLSRHHINEVQYDNLLKQQNGICLLCGMPETATNKFAVDHDHTCCSGKKSCGKCIRGIIHARCNSGIGQLNDDPVLIMKAYIYLTTQEKKIMSSFRTQETNINDAQCLTDALKAMGYKPEVNKEKVGVRGHGYESRKAEIILKKEDLKEGGDVGFAKGKDGNFSIVTDTYVMRNGFQLEKFTKEIKQKYAEVKIRKQAATAGLTFLKRVDVGNGGFKMQFVKA